MSKWESVTLGELIKIKHGFAFEGEYFEEQGEYVLLTPGNINLTGGLKITGKEKSYSGEFPKSFIFDEGDLVVVMTDLIQDAPILGGAFIIPEGGKYLHNQRLGLVTVNERADKQYVYYLLNSEAYRGQVRGTATGATVRHTAPERIYKCKILLPPLPLQRQIAAVLRRYDALLENYQAQIAALEGMAQELYREWFVRGRCPVAKPDEGLHKLVPLNQLAKVNPKAFNADENKEVQYIDISSVGQGYINEITKYQFGNAPGRARRAVQDGDIIFATVRPENRCFALIIRPDENMVVSTGFAVISPVKPFYSCYIYCQFYNESFVAEIANKATGAAYPQVGFDDLMETKIVFPSEDAIKAFDKIVKPMFDKVANLQAQITTLRATRDALLPRLLSGQLLPAATPTF